MKKLTLLTISIGLLYLPACDNSAHRNAQRHHSNTYSQQVDEISTQTKINSQSRAQQNELVGFRDNTTFRPQQTSIVSTIGLDADTGSYHHAMQHLQNNTLPNIDSIRSEEFINAAAYNYEKPHDLDLSINHSIVQTGQQQYLLRIGIQARDAYETPKRRIIAVVDTSGSMQQENRLVSCKRALHRLVRALAPHDELAIIRYANSSSLIQRYTSNKRILTDCINNLDCGGSSNLEAGVCLAFDYTRQFTDNNYQQSVILYSDGIANVGKTKAHHILNRVKNAQLKGISLFTIGVGEDAYNDKLMEQLADNGNGTYHYLSCDAQFDQNLGEKILNELNIVAYNTKAQIRFNANLIRNAHLIGYKNRSIAHHEYFDRRIDGADIPAGQCVTLLYQIYSNHPLQSTAINNIGELGIRWQQKFLENDKEINYIVDSKNIITGLINADRNTKTAWIQATFANTLKNPRSANWYQLLSILESLHRDYPNQYSHNLRERIQTASLLHNIRIHRDSLSKRW